MNEFQREMQPWPALAPFGRTVKLLRGGLSVFVFDSGASDKPPLVLIHGLGDEADTWRHVFGPLSERYRVVALDLPGFGRSEKPNRAYALSFLRDTVVDLLDTLKLTPATLMGSSLGAVIAQAVALAHPAHVRELILLDGSITSRAQKVSPVILRMALPFLGEQMYSGLRGQPQAAYDSLRPYYANLDALPEADRQFLYQRVNERVWSNGQMRAFLSILRQLVWSLPLQQKNMEAQLTQLTTPTHAIWGELDVINSVESGRALATVQKSARLTVLPGVGHLPQQEAPKELLAVI
ncbi:MAG: alpha/beta fold hydrolase [Anaerolineales bacterium]|nr:alpha/beta fold hydrolase [Anaerolineales bacterium]